MKKLICLILTLALLLAACGGCSKPAESGDLSSGGGSEENSSLVNSESAGKSDNIYYPENQYIMDVEHFVNRENDEYINYLFKVLSSTYWRAVADSHLGFSSGEELCSQILFNVFFTAAEDYSDDYIQEDRTTFIIPVSDIRAVLDKYFDDYTLDIHDVTYNFTYLENGEYICSPGFIGVYPSVGFFYHIGSITDNGDGTLTVEMLVREVKETETDFVPTDRDREKHIFIIEPGENYCIVHSYKVENLLD